MPFFKLELFCFQLNNDIGKCGVIWDIYDGLTAGICVYVLDGMVTAFTMNVLKYHLFLDFLTHSRLQQSKR